MSNIGQILGTAIGATIGFIIGGPAGAFTGAQLGLLGGSALFPTELPGQQGPRLEDIENLQIAPGSPIALGWGAFAVPGFPMYLGPVTETTTTEEVGGKGPPSQELTTFSYFQTIGLGLVEGPIQGVSRIWENGDLVYDTREQQDGESDDDYAARLVANDDYEDTFTLYFGDEEQLADPTFETERGTGNVPGYRGLAYIAYADREMKPDQGNRHPAFKFEINQTPPPDPVIFLESGTWTVPDNVNSVNVLVVAGGGSGAGPVSGGRGGGGGGAGGVVYQTDISVTPGADITVVVGAGGLLTSVGFGLNGTDSSFGALVATGGGHGGLPFSDFPGGFDGGSGGGGAYITGHEGNTYPGGAGVAGQGHSGGDGALLPDRNCGGGGGAGLDGIDANAGRPGDGGIGVDYSELFGTDVGEDGWFGGGGAGGAAAASPIISATGGKGGGGSSTAGGLNEDGQENTGGGGGGYGVGGSGIVIIQPAGAPDAKAAISDVITDIVGRVAPALDIDVTDLEDVEVDGYVIARETSARAAIEPLRTIGLFDYVERGTTLAFPVRGGDVVKTLTSTALGATVQGQEFAPQVTTKKIQDVELPRRIRLQYSSKSRDYERGEQLSPARIGTVGVNEVTVAVPIVLDDDAAAQAAEIMFRDAWAGRWSHEFSIDASHHDLDPADPVIIPVDGRNQRVRILTIDDSGLVVRKMSAARDDYNAYVSTAIATGQLAPSGGIQSLGTTDVELLDLPALRDDDNNAGFYVAPRRSGGTTWRGARLHKSIDGGSTYSPLLAMSAQAAIGTVVSAPASGDGYTWDNEAEYQIDILSGSLQSRTDAAVLAGANACAVGADGRWHIFQFATQTLVLGSRYKLTRLLLGRRGTEHLIGTVEVGDTFVVVSGSGIYRAPLQTTEIGVSRKYVPVTFGAAFSTGTAVDFTGNGEALETLTPVYVRGARDDYENLTISWLRRDRLSQTLTDGVAVAMSETTESYEVDILDEYDTVLRTLESTSHSVSYSAADQITDFGDTQSAVSVKVYQLSSVVGRGHPAEATV